MSIRLIVTTGILYWWDGSLYRNIPSCFHLYLLPYFTYRYTCINFYWFFCIVWHCNLLRQYICFATCIARHVFSSVTYHFDRFMWKRCNSSALATEFCFLLWPISIYSTFIWGSFRYLIRYLVIRSYKDIEAAELSDCSEIWQHHCWGTCEIIKQYFS